MDKAPKSQRKAPRQSRSKALVDALFEATIRILPKVGSDGLTAKKVSDAAGVSVGSFYQYFPNKDSLLASLMDAFVNAQASDFLRHVDRLESDSLQEAIERCVDFVFELFLEDRGATRELYRRAPDLGLMPTLYRLRREAVERLAGEMQKHAPGRPAEVYDRASFVAVNSVMGVVQTMIYDESEATQSRSRAELAAELKASLLSYCEARIAAAGQAPAADLP